MENKPPVIHASAIVDTGARIGQGSRVWHFTHIMPGAVIGDHCVIGQNVYIDNEVSIGDGCKIQNNVSVYKGVNLEEQVFIGPSVVFTNVINPRAFIERKTEFRPTLVKKGATIGANATILCGITIGEYALIGAGAVVTADVSPYALVLGNPGRQTGWISKAGGSLDFNAEKLAFCPLTGESYVIIDNKVSPAK